MSSRLKVDLILQDRHWSAFRSFASQPSTTVDSLHQWLTSRGYKLCRGAAWNALKSYQGDIGKFKSDVDARRKARAGLNRLRGKKLHAVAFVVMSMANVGGKIGKVRKSA